MTAKINDGGPAFPAGKGWAVDIDTGQPDVPMDAQAKQLMDNMGTDRQWCAICTQDADGIAEVVALAHPDNARLIVACVNARAEAMLAEREKRRNKG